MCVYKTTWVAMWASWCMCWKMGSSFSLRSTGVANPSIISDSRPRILPAKLLDIISTYKHLLQKGFFLHRPHIYSWYTTGHTHTEHTFTHDTPLVTHTQNIHLLTIHHWSHTHRPHIYSWYTTGPMHTYHTFTHDTPLSNISISVFSIISIYHWSYAHTTLLAFYQYCFYAHGLTWTGQWSTPQRTRPPPPPRCHVTGVHSGCCGAHSCVQTWSAPHFPAICTHIVTEDSTNYCQPTALSKH